MVCRFTIVYNVRRFYFRIASPAADFKRGNNRNSFGFADTFKVGELLNRCFAQFVQIIIVMVQDALAQFNRGFIPVAGAYEYGDQFGVG